MQIAPWSKKAALVASLLTLVAGSAVCAADTTQSTDVSSEIQALKSRIAELERKESSNWLTEERTAQIKGVVEEVIADAKTRGQFADGADFGYDKGFFIQTPDKNYRLVINGYIQARYTYAKDTYTAAYKTTKGANSSNVDVNGFDFRRARLIFSGNAFTPDLTYNVTGDFAGDEKNAAVTTSKSDGTTNQGTTLVPTDQNFFQIVDLYVAYRFSDLVNVRVGSFLSPFSRSEYITSGLEFVDMDPVLNPFDPQRSIGVSVYGQPIKNQFSYEVNVNNGQKSNTLGRVGEQGTGSNDNRLAFYSRLQYASSTLADFNDEPDLRKDNSTLAWQVGAAAGYESANSTTTGLPNPQAQATITGLSSAPSPGFVSTYILNGDIYRATVDFAAKYRGFSLTSAAYFQQINENQGTFYSSSTTPAGNTSSPGIASPASFHQGGYDIQAGYMITKKIEVVGRFGQLLTETGVGPNRMEEYALGLNYYIYGQNLKVQTDMTYIPNEAAFSSSTYSTLINTQDLIFRAQLQLKF